MKHVTAMVCLLAVVLPARAATNRTAATADQHYQAGLDRQFAAEAAANPTDARRLYQGAVAQYRAAAQAEPGHCPAHTFWAVGLAQLVPLATNNQERVVLIRAADQQFARASKCPEADYVVFEGWAALLLDTIYGLTPVDQRPDLLGQVVAICRRGLEVAINPTPRAQLQRRLGGALMLAADNTPNVGEQQALLRQAVDELRAASRVITVRQVLYEHGTLGVALLSRGRLAGSTNDLRAAATEFEAALKFHPNNYGLHYDLAAAYSLLGDAAQAGKHLAVVIDHDPDGAFHRLAEQDPDLAPVRGSPAYVEALDRRRRRLAEARAGELFQQGLEAQRAAEIARDPTVTTRFLRQAVGLYEQTIELIPDHFRAHVLCAGALAQIGNLHLDQPGLWRQLFEAARARFQAAAQCPDADPQLYQQWAGFLLTAWYPQLTNTADQVRVLEEARGVLTEGVQRARFSGSRGRLAAQLGTCLVRLADTVGGTNAIPLYAEAAQHFEAGEAATEGVGRSAAYYERWGIALLRAGQGTRDYMLMRQAAACLSKSLALNPDSPVAHYNLACAHAQLSRLDLALHHLERSFANDPDNRFRVAAAADPDFNPLRETEEFQKLLLQSDQPRPPPRPTVSGK